MDVSLFVTSSMAIMAASMLRKKKRRRQEDTSERFTDDVDDILWVDQDNQPLHKQDNNNTLPWYRATFILILHEPPHLYYEPKEWSETTVLLQSQESDVVGHPTTILHLSLPGGPVSQKYPTYEQSAIQHLRQRHHIDVCAPQNCLHHLFTFPLAMEQNQDDDDEGRGMAGVWGDFYECVARGSLPDFSSLVSFSLAELKQMVVEHSSNANESTNNQTDSSTSATSTKTYQFTRETLYALKLYFQRQGDLRAKRRLLKGYSSTDLEKYGLRHSSSSGGGSSSTEKLVLTDLHDTQRQKAIDYTMKCDDGMSPNLLYQADVVLLGVSRAGKTPMSIFMAQTMGLKVANIPLVMELTPPRQLEKVDPRKVFCLTLQPEYLADFRRNRFQREMSRKMKRHSGGYSSLGGLGLGGSSSSSIGDSGSCSYADSSYVQRDLDNARALARTHVYTEIDVTGKAMEETSQLILSKLQERFPDQSCYHGI